MLTTSNVHGRGFRAIAGSALRWITAFDPFGAYAPDTARR